ncbi:MAG: protein-L-isoaspartate(D-aspartate) O-methyltransferase [Methanoregulaceae archaeon]
MDEEERYGILRQEMVENQIAARGIRNPRVLAAMREVPRHLFVPERYRSESYADSPLPIGEGQTISQPFIVAFMTELLSPGPEDTILEIGAGSGYQAAILSRLARSVISIERISEVAEMARRNLAAVGAGNVSVMVGDGTLGWKENAPYDGILVTAAGPLVPPALLEQLAEGGRLVVPVGDRDVQDLVRMTRKNGRIGEERYGGVRFVPLIGKQGWGG